MLIVKLRVQRSKKLNTLEIINEFLIQTATVHLAIFDMCSIDQQQIFGTFFIFVIILTVFVNIINIFINLAFEYSSLFKMINNNSNNLSLKFKSLIESNETFIQISKLFHCFKSKIK